MANEIALSASLSVANGGLSLSQTDSLNATQSALGGNQVIQLIGTSAETVTLTDITTAGYAFFKNLDSTHFIKIGPDSSGMVDFVKLLPGEFAVMRLATNTVKAVADTAASKLLIMVLET